MTENSLFRSSGYLENGVIADADGRPHRLADLPPFLRTLLVADGTVTKALEAYFWEPVEVRQIGQSLQPQPLTVPELPHRSTDRMLYREVSLEGRRSGSRYALARSFLVLDNLPSHFAGAIVSGKMGIGELLREQGVETYRDIIRLGYASRESLSDDRLKDLDSDIVSRAYRISVSGIPAILVTEHFPLARYAV